MAFCRQFRLEDRRDRHRMARYLRGVPVELWRVQAWQLDLAELHLAPLVHEFGDDRLGEAFDRVYRWETSNPHRR